MVYDNARHERLCHVPAVRGCKCDGQPLLKSETSGGEWWEFPEARTGGVVAGFRFFVVASCVHAQELHSNNSQGRPWLQAEQTKPEEQR